MQTINALLYATSIYILTLVISLFVGVIIVIIGRASAGRIKPTSKK